ncbi:hypothetical protein JT05_03770 [Desulfosporosinus sp. Tol-M]|nr:hypothetical protein JT05_03770 [Desulfosporosinus sp. Tol-M]
MFVLLKKILIAIVAIVVIVGIASSMGDNGKTTAPTSNQSTSKPADTKPPVEVIKVTAVDLAAAYESNEVKADQTYKGKTAEIAGTVDSIGVVLDQTYVTLSSGKDFAIVSTQCFFEDKTEIAKVAELKKGDKVTVQGVIEGKSMNVGVKKCILK